MRGKVGSNSSASPRVYLLGRLELITNASPITRKLAVTTSPTEKPHATILPSTSPNNLASIPLVDALRMANESTSANYRQIMQFTTDSLLIYPVIGARERALRCEVAAMITQQINYQTPALGCLFVSINSFHARAKTLRPSEVSIDDCVRCTSRWELGFLIFSDFPTSSRSNIL